ncbi:MAG: hypothetical protein JXR44_05745 [Thiotrichales bacterium]|nr:hypothetical protein [Thiotrichales bacterium]
MKQILIAALMIGVSVPAMAAESQDSQNREQVVKAYFTHIESGKSFPDAFALLAYEIAYEKAAVQATSPCRKLLRGL